MTATLTLPVVSKTTTITLHTPASSTTTPASTTTTTSISAPSCAPASFTRPPGQKGCSRSVRSAGPRPSPPLPAPTRALPNLVSQFPTKTAVVVGSVLAVRLSPSVWVCGSAAATALLVIMVELLLYYVGYCMFLYPLYFSPLLYLPTLKHDSLLTAQLGIMAANPVMLPTPQEIAEIENTGLVRQIYAFNRERIIVASAEAMVEVLSHRNYEFPKPETVQNILTPFLGRGLITVEGDEHKKQRRHVSPAFAIRHIKELYPLFLSKGRELCREIVAQDGLENTDASDWMNRVALDVVSVAAAGCDFGAVRQKHNDLTDAYYAAFTSSMLTILVRIFQYLTPPWLFSILPLPGKNTIQASSDTIKEICRSCIRSKKKAQTECKAGKDRTESDKDILSIAMRSGAFTDEELMYQLMTFFMAGHETTSTALAWAIYQLCANPQIQDRLRAEIRATAPDILNSESKVSSTEIDSMPYMAAIWNETLRLHPPVWLTAREVACDTTINNKPVPAGTELILGISIFNRSPIFWGPDAEEFKPERWLVPGQELTGGASSRYMNMTFLYGPHGCIGKDFARGEFSSILACLLTQFEIEFADPNYQVALEFTGIVTRPRDLWVNFKPLK